jgi:hypothetical protein
MEQIPAFYFQPDQLRKLADLHRDAFRTAEPFAHVVFDRFVPDEILDVVVREFPEVDQIDWTFYGPGATRHSANKGIEKVGSSDENQFGLFTRHFMQQLNSGAFLRFLEDLTGTRDIIADPTYNDCGMHSTGRGGRLLIHTDTNRHPIKGPFHQRYNLILFLNKEWREEYGGHLELWDRTAKKCIRKILPEFNRCVIFDTGRHSFHGHPHPLACPEGRRRNSLALYYYVLDRPNSDNYAGMQTEVTWVPTAEDRIRQTLKKFIPPIVFDVRNRIRRRVSR